MNTDFSDWTSEFPTQEGYYWFFGYEDVRASFKTLMMVKVVTKGIVRSETGDMLYKDELGREWQFKKCPVPQLPTN